MFGIDDLIGGAIGGIAGGIGGLFGSKNSQNTTSGVNLRPTSDAEQTGYNYMFNAASDLEAYTGAYGPGAGEVKRSTQTDNDLAEMFRQYSISGGMPSSSDLAQGNTLAQSVFAPQQTALDQSFRDQNTQFERLAARLGRPTDDPILQAKMRTGFMDQSARLQSEQGSFGTQYAMSLPGQRVNYKQQESAMRGQLASQAFANRTAMLNMGSQIMNNERNWRYQISDKFSNTEQQKGGGVGDAITGAMGGIGQGFNMMRGFGGGQSGGGYTPSISGVPSSSGFSMPSFGAGFQPPQPQFGSMNSSQMSMPSFGGGSYSSYQPSSFGMSR